MKSNIGFVFVVNSEKAFGRFVKESAGEEEMTSCSSSGEWRTSHLEQLSSRRRESLVESETSLVKLFDKICRGSEFLIFYLVHQQGAVGNARSDTPHQIHLSPFRPNLPTYLGKKLGNWHILSTS